MSKLHILTAVLLLGAVCTPAGADPGFSTAGPADATVAESPRLNPCPESEFYLNGDGDFENAYSLSPFLTVEPDWGALAEGYLGVIGSVCGLGVYLTRTIDNYDYGYLDAYLWDFDSETDSPGAIMAMVPDLEVTGIGHWPIVTLHELALPDSPVGEDGFFIGFWPHPWDPQPNAYHTAADMDGPPGLPRVKILPDQGYPSGWQHPSAMGIELNCWGIGAYVLDVPVPDREASWGAVKALYR